MRPSEDIIFPSFIAISYFSSVYFLITALTTVSIALIIAPLVTLLALLWLAWLRYMGMAERGLPIIVLAGFPLTIAVCGAGAWIARFLVG